MTAYKREADYVLQVLIVFHCNFSAHIIVFIIEGIKFLVRREVRHENLCGYEAMES